MVKGGSGGGTRAISKSNQFSVFRWSGEQGVSMKEQGGDEVTGGTGVNEKCCWVRVDSSMKFQEFTRIGFVSFSKIQIAEIQWVRGVKENRSGRTSLKRRDWSGRKEMPNIRLSLGVFYWAFPFFGREEEKVFVLFFGHSLAR